MWYTTGELNDFNTSLNFTFGILKSFPMLLGDGFRQLVMILLKQFEEAKHDSCSP